MLLLSVLVLLSPIISHPHRWLMVGMEGESLMSEGASGNLGTAIFLPDFEIKRTYFDSPKANPRKQSGRYRFKPTVPK